MAIDAISMKKLKKITVEKDYSPFSYLYSNRDNELPSGEYLLDKIYETKIEDRSFKLYKYKYKVWKEEFDYEWQSSIKLELADKGGDIDYEFEYDNSFNDLYSIVREQCSNVIDVIDSILGLTLGILKATYGPAKVSIDITDRLREKIKNNKLNILADNSIQGDPEVGVVKKLKVKYTFGDETFEKEVAEGQRIILP